MGLNEMACRGPVTFQARPATAQEQRVRPEHRYTRACKGEPKQKSIDHLHDFES